MLLWHAVDGKLCYHHDTGTLWVWPRVKCWCVSTCSNTHSLISALLTSNAMLPVQDCKGSAATGIFKFHTINKKARLACGFLSGLIVTLWQETETRVLDPQVSALWHYWLFLPHILTPWQAIQNSAPTVERAGCIPWHKGTEVTLPQNEIERSISACTNMHAFKKKSPSLWKRG